MRRQDVCPMARVCIDCKPLSGAVSSLSPPFACHAAAVPAIWHSPPTPVAKPTPAAGITARRFDPDVSCTYNDSTLQSGDSDRSGPQVARQMRRGSVQLLAKSRPFITPVRAGILTLSSHSPSYALRLRQAQAPPARIPMVSTRAAAGGAAAEAAPAAAAGAGVNVNMDVTRQNFKEASARHESGWAARGRPRVVPCQCPKHVGCAHTHMHATWVGPHAPCALQAMAPAAG